MLARKLAAASAVALFSAGAFAVAGHTVAAPKIDVSHDKVVCTSVYGSVAFGTPLVLGGTVPTTLAVKGVAKDCTDVTNPKVTGLTSTFSGTLSAPSNNALSLLGIQNVTGTLTMKWKSDKSAPILQTSSVVTPNAICGGTMTLPAPFNAAPRGEFHIGAQAHCGSGGAQPASTVTGAFAGNDAGATSVTDAITVQDINALTGPATGAGLTGVNLALGTITVG